MVTELPSGAARELGHIIMIDDVSHQVFEGSPGVASRASQKPCLISPKKDLLYEPGPSPLLVTNKLL